MPRKKIPKVTPTKCLKGKRHKWMDIDIRGDYGSIDYKSWCKTCGCRTEFFKTKDMKKRERCYVDDKVPYIDIPEHLKE